MWMRMRREKVAQREHSVKRARSVVRYEKRASFFVAQMAVITYSTDQDSNNDNGSKTKQNQRKKIHRNEKKLTPAAFWTRNETRLQRGLATLLCVRTYSCTLAKPGNRLAMHTNYMLTKITQPIKAKQKQSEVAAKGSQKSKAKKRNFKYDRKKTAEIRKKSEAQQNLLKRDKQQIKAAQ